MAKNIHADQLGKSGELHVARFLEHRQRLQKLALAWLALHGKFGSEYRIDAAAVLLRRGIFEIDYREAVA